MKLFENTLIREINKILASLFTYGCRHILIGYVCISALGYKLGTLTTPNTELIII
jgi:hypothetical protein